MNKLFLNHLFLVLCGAYNDTVLRVGLMTILTRSLNLQTLSQLSTIFLLLPIILFGYWSGCLATKYRFNLLITIIKFMELVSVMLFHIGIMSLKYNEYVAISYFLIGLSIAGIHTALYSPIKYSILDYIFNGKKKDISAAASIMQGITFSAIFFGSISGSLILEYQNYILILIYFFSISGLLSSFFYPPYGEQIKSTKLEFFNFNIYAKIPSSTLKFIYYVSWFWFFSTLFQMPIINIIQVIFNAEQYIFTLTSLLSSIGLVFGSILLVLYLKTQYNKRQTRISLMLITVLSIIFTINLFLSSPGKEEILIGNIFNHLNIMIVAICMLFIPMLLSIYSLPFMGDIINSIDDRKELNKIIGLYCSISTTPILLAAFISSIFTAFLPYWTIYLFLSVIVIIETFNHEE